MASKCGGDEEASEFIQVAIAIPEPRTGPKGVVLVSKPIPSDCVRRRCSTDNNNQGSKKEKE
jgi:hypothetical protein